VVADASARTAVGCTTTIVGVATCRFGHVVVEAVLARVARVAVAVVVVSAAAASVAVAALRVVVSGSVDRTGAAIALVWKVCRRQCRAFRARARSSVIGRLVHVRRLAIGRVVPVVHAHRSVIGRVVLAVLVARARRLAIVVRVRVAQGVRAAHHLAIVVRVRVVRAARRRWVRMRDSSRMRSDVGVRPVSAMS